MRHSHTQIGLTAIVAICTIYGAILETASAAVTYIKVDEPTAETVPLTDPAAILASLSNDASTLASLVAELEPTPATTHAATEVTTDPPIADPVEADEPITNTDTSGIRLVPFYSQFADISDPSWRKVGCGIAATAMLIDFYTNDSISVDALLKRGIAENAYLSDAGWTHQGLINLAANHGLTGQTVGLSHLNMTDAFATLETAVAEGPVMVSVHYNFEPTNPIPHLVVVTDVVDNLVHYNDPAEEAGNGTITIATFQNAWKKRYIAIRPSA